MNWSVNSLRIAVRAGRRAACLWLIGCVALLHVGQAFAAAPLRFAGSPAELAVSEISERTVRIELFPLDEQRNPIPAARSTVLVPFPVIEKLRVRELSGEREVRVGQLQLGLKPQPLTVSVRDRKS